MLLFIDIILSCFIFLVMHLFIYPKLSVFSHLKNTCGFLIQIYKGVKGVSKMLLLVIIIFSIL